MGKGRASLLATFSLKGGKGNGSEGVHSHTYTERGIVRKVHTHTRTRTLPCTLTHIHFHTYSYIHVHSHIHLHHTYTSHTHTYTSVYTRTYTYIHTYTFPCTHSHMQTHEKGNTSFRRNEGDQSQSHLLLRMYQHKRKT